MKTSLKYGLAACAALSLCVSSSILAQDASQDAIQEQELGNDEESLNILIEEGDGVYTNSCAVCHGEEGEGGVGPALADSSFLESRSATVYQILYGATDHGMPAFAPQLSDREIAAVSTYIRNAWENDYSIVLPRSVELRRSAGEPEEGEDTVE